jgi:hypothetical protein
MGQQRPETCRVRGNIRNKDIKLVASVGTFICNRLLCFANLYLCKTEKKRFQIDTVSVLVKDDHEFKIYVQCKKCCAMLTFRGLFFITLHK